VIELDQVTQHYGVRPVLRGISLRIERGEVVVILGPNGMGNLRRWRLVGEHRIGRSLSDNKSTFVTAGGP
jgi:ABC-type transporter Mla maintaining outer membrane lipid asymmetry ATPase subunit MlaF